MSGPSRLVERKISVTFLLETGSFEGNVGNTATVDNFRVNCLISAAQAVPSQCHLQIFGLPPSMMNKLSTLGMLLDPNQHNTVTVQAGDDVSGMSTVFIGAIYTAWADFGSIPDVCLNVISTASASAAMTPIPVSSYQGSIDVATVISNIASQMNCVLENSGVNGRFLSNPYFPGTALTQLESAAKAANINWFHDEATHTVAIWPIGGQRQGETPLISADEGGMIGVPTFTANGIHVNAVYNPNIRLGCPFQCKSQLAPQANGTWSASNIQINLESQTPGGNWSMQFEGIPLGLAVRGW